MNAAWIPTVCIAVLAAAPIGPRSDDPRPLYEEIMRRAIIDRLAAVPPDGFEHVRPLTRDDDALGGALVLEQRHGRGMLSTYYTTFRIRAIGGLRILGGGRPLAIGESIAVADLIGGGVDEATLCTVGASLRLVNESFETFSGGDWWGRHRAALGLMRVRDGVVSIGYALLSVSKRGEVTLHGVRLTELRPAQVTVVDGFSSG